MIKFGSKNTLGYPSGQRGQTVNLLAHAYIGSNPIPSTCAILAQFPDAQSGEPRVLIVR